MFVTIAPDFSAEPLTGGEAVPLASLLAEGPVALVFFKVSCPTCQLAFPFFERLHQAPGNLVRVVGVSQDDAVATAKFTARFGSTFPILLDRASAGYPASNAYGLTHVPSIFVVETNGEISQQWTGFNRMDFEKLAARFPTVVFRPEDNVPSWKAG